MTRKILPVIILILAVLATILSPTQAQADRYVRAGAQGSNNGSDWTNAYTSIATAAANITRGETIWVAGGTYGAVTFNVPVSGTTLIFVKKATVAAHGTGTGWSNTYGDGQAEIIASGTPVSVATNYWVLDGEVGSGNSGHGFKATVTGTADATRGIRITATGNVTISHWEITSTNPAGVADSSKQDGIYSTSASNVTIKNCYIHEWKRCAILFSGVTGWVVESNYIYHTYSTSGSHGQAIQMGPGAVSNVDIRYNTFKDCHGTGMIVALDNIFDNIRIYGNIFWEEESSAAIGIYSTSQLVGITTGDTISNSTFHNNTIINVDGRGEGVSAALDYQTANNNTAYNNIWVGCTPSFSGITHDYNACSGTGCLSEAHEQEGLTTSIFANYAGGDFRLTGATNAGTTLSSPYNSDWNRNTRGADGVWDRGAFEYGGVGGPPPPPPPPLLLPNPPGSVLIQ